VDESTELSEPVVEPTEPTVEPTEPVAEPTEPIAEPTEPTEPVAEPTEEPTEPIAEPTPVLTVILTDPVEPKLVSKPTPGQLGVTSEELWLMVVVGCSVAIGIIIMALICFGVSVSIKTMLRKKSSI